MTEDEERDRVDIVAREFIGTPYHDLGEVKGRKGGVDCAKLLKLVYVEAGKIKPFDIGYYAPQHFLHQDEERYLGWVLQFAHEIPLALVRHGDIVLYKIGKVFAHGAIVIKPGWSSIIHAHYRAKMVVEGRGTSPHLGTPILGVRYFSMWG